MSLLQMSNRRGAALSLALLLASSTPGSAQNVPKVDPAARSAPSGCAAFKWPLDKERKALESASLESIASGTARGAWKEQAFTLALQPDTEVPFTLPPTKRKKDDDKHRFGAIVAFAAPAKGGTYQVTLSGAGWIDLVQNGKALKPSDHSGAKDCPGLRKSVRFTVDAAPLVLQISGAPDQSIKIAIGSVD